MDDRKRLGIFIIGTAFIIIVIIAVFMYIFNQKQKAAELANTPTKVETDANKLFEEAQKNKAQPGYAFDPAAEKNRDLNQEDLRKIAMSIAARFGSYSNQSNYGNIEDLRLLMTSDMQDWADTYVANLKKQNKDSSVYYGITSVPVSGEVKSFDDKAGTATVMATMQRKEVIGTADPKIFTQDILITFEKVKGDWKAASATWQK